MSSKSAEVKGGAQQEKQNMEREKKYKTPPTRGVRESKRKVEVARNAGEEIKSLRKKREGLRLCVCVRVSQRTRVHPHMYSPSKHIELGLRGIKQH